MLRPTRRHSRSLFTVLAVLTSVGLLWPAGISAGSRSGATAGAGASAPHSDREPSVHGLGVKSLDAGRGHGPSKPLEKLSVDRSDRGQIAPGLSGTEAPTDTTGAIAPATVPATDSNQPQATSFVPVEGLDQAAVGGLEPPDPWVAVGPNDVVQTVDDNLRFMNREGTATAGNIAMFEFFDLANFEVSGAPLTIDGIADPRWLYDAKHDRWIGETMGWHCDAAGSTGFIFGAISLTGDPTGDYYNFYILYEGFLPDFPMVGTSGDKFTISADERILASTATNCTTGAVFDAASLTTFDWADMLTFPASPDFSYFFFPTVPAGQDKYRSLRPAVSPQGATNTLFVIGELPVLPGNTTSDIVYFRITGTNAAGTVAVTTPIDLTSIGIVGPFVNPPLPVNPGAAFTAGIVGRRPTDAIWQDGVMTIASTGPCPVGTRACARVIQLSTGTATPTLRQDFAIPGVPASDTWFPGVGQSQSGILHVVYTQSSSTDGMSSLDRYQLPSDALNTLSDVREIADGGTGGTIDYGGNRWGEYVGVAQDPRDTNAVWQANQYTKSATGTGNWGTKVSELQTAGSTFVGIAPVRVLDSRINLGTTGAFVNGVPKTVSVIANSAIPDNAVAITGNLTVTDQQKSGFAALTPLPVANPATSTVNFSAGGSRANNITSPLSNAGAVSLTYKATTAGGTAHLILDVTGYFLNNTPGQTYHVLTPVRVLDTRDGTGLSGRFKTGVNRQFNVASVLTVPANATAITGNLTVTDQTAAGFVVLSTTAPPANPPTSTINFPATGAAANGTTVKLSPTGTLFAQYKAASAGKTTNLVLDVTGYYTNDSTGASFVALAPGRRLDTRLPAPPEGLTGVFQANVARTLVVEPYQGVPASAIAITGNLTIVGQTKGGFVAMTPTANNNPPTSTLNFAVGDILANGVTGPLSAPGSVGLTYRTNGGGTTHLILDLTGYFR